MRGVRRRLKSALRIALFSLLGNPLPLNARASRMVGRGPVGWWGAAPPYVPKRGPSVQMQVREMHRLITVWKGYFS